VVVTAVVCELLFLFFSFIMTISFDAKLFLHCFSDADLQSSVDLQLRFTSYFSSGELSAYKKIVSQLVIKIIHKILYFSVLHLLPVPCLTHLKRLQWRGRALLGRRASIDSDVNLNSVVKSR